MAKAKRKQPGALPTSKDIFLSGSVDTISGSEGNSHDEDDWVIVKKQRVTILIPPPPVSEQLIARGPRKKLTPMKSRKTAENRQVNLSKRCLQKCFAGEQKKIVDMTTEEDVHINETFFIPAINPAEELRGPPFRTALEGLNRLVVDSPSQPLSLDFAHGQYLYGTCGSSKAIIASGLEQNIKEPTIAQSSSLFLKSLGCLNNSLLRSKKLRASNLERKLNNAGGLSRWLLSLGLEQFVQIFRRNNMNKFQLLSLTMSKLKDMGADAVGPRRKLIHAIECLSQPYYFKAF
ncbi:hypothetical protein Syun_002359 [Stephania yunnanensis]|uniref:SAM domain-containing protein n=1 Tax=Stephania yunnanensis TaxID=152371 RepID=A0AAP0LJK1_9MAGN